MSSKVEVTDEFLASLGYTRERYEALSRGARWSVRNKERAKQYSREGRLLSEYDITQEDYNRMLESQGGVCKICEKPEDKVIGSKVIELAVDHCHSSGKVRGLLCQRCNTGIAKFDDSTDNLRAAITYLEKYND